MRLLRPLVPHALVSVAIVVASVVAMGRAVGDPRPGPEPTASAAIAPAQLSTTGRLAYWWPSPGDDLELWVSDLDGTRRFPIATVPKRADIDLTRWSPDGDAVAWIADGVVQVVRLDRTRVTVSLPADLPSDWKPVTVEWSPSSRRLAATLRAAHGVSNEGDVFVADLDRPSRATGWVRRTTTGDAYAAPWLDEDRLLVETAGATIGVLSTAGTGPARPLTAMPAVSPRIGPDGRLYFFGGRWGAAPLFSGPLAAGAVWSMTIDGDDLRRETAAERDQGRLQGFLGNGRFIVGVPGALYVTGEEAVLFPWRTGVVRRAVASPDGRRVIGLTESRIVRADPAKIPRSASAGDPPADATAVLLDAVKAPDAWFPASPVALAHAARGADGPREALTFTFGRSLWRLGPGGDVRPLLMAPRGGWVSGGIPSPSGDRLVVTVSAPQPSDGRPGPTTVILDRQGQTVTTLGGSGTASWSPDGTRLALSVWTDTDGYGGYALQLYDTATWKPLERLEHTRGVWTDAGLVLIDDGRRHPNIPDLPWVRVGQGIDLLTASGRRHITDADRLARHPLLRGVMAAETLPAIASVFPSAKGTNLLVGITQFGADGRGTFTANVVVRSDGEPARLLRTDTGAGGLMDLTWSPSADLLGATLRMPGPPGQDFRTTLVLDASGATVLEREGRFAGWSRDGLSVYVARREGLFEVRTDGSAEVRVSALGVAPVLATPP